MTKEQFKDISKWQNETFGEATAFSKVMHLKQEIDELIKELVFFAENEDHMQFHEASKTSKENEFADCFILLFGAAASDGMNYEQIVDCINHKMQINKARKWGKPDENGVVNHIKE